MAIRINFLTQFDNRGIKQAQRELASVGRNLSRSLDFAVGGALAGATAGLISSVKAASNYAAEFEGVNQVFGKAAKSVQGFADTAAKTAGLSATEALQASKVFGLFAQSAGLSGQSAADFSTTLVQLAGDLGSFNDVPTAEALDAIQSGLQGQAEPLRKFGVFLTEDALKQEYLAQTGQKVVGALSAQQKMMASYGLIMKQTTIQQGDFTKYGNTMGNSLKTLTKTMEDLSAEIGGQLVPVIEEVLPVFQEMIPVIGQQLKDAVASVDWKAFAEGIITGVSFLINNGENIVKIIGLVYGLAKAFTAVKIATDLAAVAFGLMTGKIPLNPIMLAVAAIGLLVAGVIALDEALKNIDNNSLVNTSTAAATRAGQAAYENYIRNAKREQTNTGPGSILPSEMIAAEKARQKAYDDALKYLKSPKRPTTGQGKNITPEKIVFDIPKLEIGSADKASKDAAKKAADEQKKLVEEFKTSITDLVGSFKSLGQASVDLGKFEKQAVDAFESINAAVAEGLKNKALTQAGAGAIYNYIRVEKVALVALARQRDILAKKINIAKAISSGFIDAANITQTESKEVIKSVTTMADGITTTLRTTFNEVLAGDITGSFKKIVDRTKAFAKNLVALKKLGLNGQLFKQIVDAGAEAGGATAEAIIAGGSDTVNELNSLFNELDRAGSDIAKESTDTFYNLGEGISSAFVDGLKSQEQLLADEIAKMVASIEAAFTAAMNKLNALNNTGYTGLVTGVASKYNPALMTGTPTEQSGSLIRRIPMMAEGGIVMPSIGGSIVNVAEAGVPEAIIPLNRLGNMGTTVINVTVNAGVGTNGKSVGQAIQAELNKYSKANR